MVRGVWLEHSYDPDRGRRLSASAMRVFVATVPYSRSPDPYKYSCFRRAASDPHFSFLCTLGLVVWSLATLSVRPAHLKRRAPSCRCFPFPFLLSAATFFHRFTVAVFSFSFRLFYSYQIRNGRETDDCTRSQHHSPKRYAPYHHHHHARPYAPLLT